MWINGVAYAQVKVAQPQQIKQVVAQPQPELTGEQKLMAWAKKNKISVKHIGFSFYVRKTDGRKIETKTFEGIKAGWDKPRIYLTSELRYWAEH